ncbi:type II toxin-antitoxin system HipA family toxin [Phocoenobacter skyensis]|uniref:Serine/threonine-protein kinase HipA n=1 Tax=Phocoenobacter skyensis TaxID=97481 RepID=A0A1H7YZ55_9PAST|nr:type II toxin-antitoxin system HipA family toxin [Pasteurella skyensis]MDP8080111.1 type II toxin-antitoxin system HipA family toxin [Pasteurella skyensis]MDP8086121.1 type II toxin-antitoxin system HipA family toxin [Pasteurella skyensis]MDP8185795.1 type II toxin-antitoxin system HipA family toxin [Pasteurella skyensis]QLB22682.1 hypothetical protein A6B44_05450 [Pasteurella skyensis]SEM51450.1 serine/threonine-protein kinase HipA [Pasteurella skyensis]
MKNKNIIQSIAVYFAGYGQYRLVGRLGLDRQRPVFSYDPTWLANGLPLSPIEMPLYTPNSNKLYYGEHRSSQYLCGLLSDSLPDGWGMLLMDRFFRQKLGKEPHDITVLDRFAYIGKKAMGALVFEPEHLIDTDNEALDLITLAQANQQVLEGKDTDILSQLLQVGGSPQGARPKAQIYFEPKSQIVSTINLSNQAESWLVKFPAQNEHKSVCLLEGLYADFAKCSGIEMPEHHYFDLSKEHSAFGVKRFDRHNGERIHIHTLAGLLNTDFRLPTLDYTQLLRCVRMMTRSQKDVERAYRQVVFNVIFNNKDDHTKNFSFIMDEMGKWSLSPAYDLTFNTGINGSIIDQIMLSAEQFLNVIKDYPLQKDLSNTVQKTIKANIKRMI